LDALKKHQLFVKAFRTFWLASLLHVQSRGTLQQQGMNKVTRKNSHLTQWHYRTIFTFTVPKAFQCFTMLCNIALNCITYNVAVTEATGYFKFDIESKSLLTPAYGSNVHRTWFHTFR